MREGKGMIKILIVEDEISISKMIEMSLKRSGYQCDCAYDGEEAVEKIGRNIYDLILLDVMLPKIDGFELMEYIRPMEIPVIFITAKDSVNDRVKGLRMGAEDYIIKPFEIIELLARVDVVLRRFRLTEAKIGKRTLRLFPDEPQQKKKLRNSDGKVSEIQKRIVEVEDSSADLLLKDRRKIKNKKNQKRFGRPEKRLSF